MVLGFRVQGLSSDFGIVFRAIHGHRFRILKRSRLIKQELREVLLRLSTLKGNAVGHVAHQAPQCIQCF